MIAVSACLIGNNVKYNGGNNKNEKVLDYLKGKEYIVICPEVMGGLPIPRFPSEIKDGKVINNQNEDVTSFFEKGALTALEKIKENNVTEVILKSRSPSCGYKKIYDGLFSHTLTDGNGIFVNMLLKEKGIAILTEEDL